MGVMSRLLNRALRRWHHKSWKWLPVYSGMTQGQLLHVLLVNPGEFWGMVNVCSGHMLCDKIDDLNEDYKAHQIFCKNSETCKYQASRLRNLVAVYHNVGNDHESFRIVNDYVEKYTKWMEGHKARMITGEPDEPFPAEYEIETSM